MLIEKRNIRETEERRIQTLIKANTSKLDKKKLEQISKLEKIKSAEREKVALEGINKGLKRKDDKIYPDTPFVQRRAKIE